MLNKHHIGNSVLLFQTKETNLQSFEQVFVSPKMSHVFIKRFVFFFVISGKRDKTNIIWTSFCLSENGSCFRFVFLQEEEEENFVTGALFTAIEEGDYDGVKELIDTADKYDINLKNRVSCWILFVDFSAQFESFRFDMFDHLHCFYRDHFRCAPSQWWTTLQCNIISHWLGAYIKWSLLLNQWPLGDVAIIFE